MKTKQEIYKAFGEGKKLRYLPSGNIVDINNAGSYNFSKPENWEIYDKFADLKKAYKEGAKIEEWYCTSEEWWMNKEPEWRTEFKYRIKNGIPVESWEKHKDLIKAWWDGAIIQVKWGAKWIDVDDNNPAWCDNLEYRVKPTKLKMHPAQWWININGSVYHEAVQHISRAQEFGMCFHSERQTEKAIDQMRRSNLLRYWVSTIQDLGSGNYKIIYSL